MREHSWRVFAASASSQGAAEVHAAVHTVFVKSYYYAVIVIVIITYTSKHYYD